MKYKKLLENMLKEDGPETAAPPKGAGAEEDPNETEATRQAHHLGLVSGGYGKWMDPKTGQQVAYTVQGHLVRNSDSAKPNDLAPKTGDIGQSAAPSPIDQPSTTIDNTQSGDEDSIQEPEGPKGKSGIEKLLAAAGGDMARLQTTLAKKFHSAQTPQERAKYNKAMQDARAYEENETNMMRDKLATLQATKDAEKEARRVALTAKYPQAARGYGA